jgi:hypothetical protein
MNGKINYFTLQNGQENFSDGENKTTKLTKMPAALSQCSNLTKQPGTEELPAVIKFIPVQCPF